MHGCSSGMIRQGRERLKMKEMVQMALTDGRGLMKNLEFILSVLGISKGLYIMYILIRYLWLLYE